jgi:hypothetical protein
LSNKDDAKTRLSELSARESRRSPEWLELPGKPDHVWKCDCPHCAHHRKTWSLAIERGVWSRERVLEHGVRERDAASAAKTTSVRDSVERQGDGSLGGVATEPGTASENGRVPKSVSVDVDNPFE